MYITINIIIPKERERKRALTHSLRGWKTSKDQLTKTEVQCCQQAQNRRNSTFSKKSTDPILGVGCLSIIWKFLVQRGENKNLIKEIYATFIHIHTFTFTYYQYRYNHIIKYFVLYIIKCITHTNLKNNFLHMFHR